MIINFRTRTNSSVKAPASISLIIFQIKKLNKNNKHVGMVIKAKVEILFPFFPPITRCMIPFPLFPAFRWEKEISAEETGTQHLVIFTETLLTPPNYNFSHIGNKVSLWIQLFLLAPCYYGRFTKRNICASAIEIPYWCCKAMFTWWIW